MTCAFATRAVAGVVGLYVVLPRGVTGPDIVDDSTSSLKQILEVSHGHVLILSLSNSLKVGFESPLSDVMIRIYHITGDVHVHLEYHCWRVENLAVRIMIESVQCSNCSFDMNSRACDRTALVICACIP
jgi:hypothetical protein